MLVRVTAMASRERAAAAVADNEEALFRKSV